MTSSNPPPAPIFEPLYTYDEILAMYAAAAILGRVGKPFRLLISE